MSSVVEKLRTELAGYEAERDELNKVIRETRAELRAAVKRVTPRGSA